MLKFTRMGKWFDQTGHANILRPARKGSRHTDSRGQLPIGGA